MTITYKDAEGIAGMRYRDFGLYNVIGGIFWILSMTLCGYAFGNLEFIRKNFSLVVLGIIFISVLPMLIEFIRLRKNKAGRA